MLFLALTLAADLPAIRNAVPFDAAIVARQCAQGDDADDLAAQLSCLEEQWLGYREFALLAQHLGPGSKTMQEGCSEKWRKAGVIDWQMARVCFNEESTPLAEATRAGSDFDVKQSRRLCDVEIHTSIPGIERPPTTAEECLNDQAIGHRAFALLKKAYGGSVLDRAFAICRTRWSKKDGPDWVMIDSCADDQVRAVERIAQFK